MDVTLDDAVRIREMHAALSPADWQAGSTEIWITEALCALAVANGTQTALETGGFQGFTSTRLATALARLPWPTTLTVCDIDAARADGIQAALDVLPVSRCATRVVAADVLTHIASLPDESLDFVFVDDDHSKQHVHYEIRALLPKMRANGLITFHDVYGVCDLAAVLAVYSHRRVVALDLPRLGPAGGLGIMQVD